MTQVSEPWFSARRVAEIRSLATRWISEPDAVEFSPEMTTIPASPDDVFWLCDALDEARRLMVEADSFISHMRHRGYWPGSDYDVDRLIAKLRPASAGFENSQPRPTEKKPPG